MQSAKISVICVHPRPILREEKVQNLNLASLARAALFLCLVFVLAVPTHLFHNLWMVNQNTAGPSDVWRLDGTTAKLCIPELEANLDLLKPHLGVSEIVFRNIAVAGHVLGVNLNNHLPFSKPELQDVYVRGNDLVATYAETKQRPFSLQVYWRVTLGSDEALLIDVILSLQTDLLESYPNLTLETKLAATTARHLSVGSDDLEQIHFNEGQPHNLAADRSGGVLLQSAIGNWSYAEMTHPEDRGGESIQRPNPESLLLCRQLSSNFLEKGVIRRLRTRGVFVPQANAEKAAANCLASLATEQPPLTV